jgi:hypothetical protein
MRDKQKQIDEMVMALHQGLKPLQETYDTETIVAILYDAGYRKQVEGAWISHEGYEECGECHAKAMFQHNFCPNCGVKMKGVAE